MALEFPLPLSGVHLKTMGRGNRTAGGETGAGRHGETANDRRRAARRLSPAAGSRGGLLQVRRGYERRGPTLPRRPSLGIVARRPYWGAPVDDEDLCFLLCFFGAASGRAAAAGSALVAACP